MAKYIDADRLLGDLAEALRKLSNNEIDRIDINKLISEQPAVDVGTNKTIKIKRIRAYLRYNPELCEKCKYDYNRYCRGRECNNCKQLDKAGRCYCNMIKNGEPCKHFERAV